MRNNIGVLTFGILITFLPGCTSQQKNTPFEPASFISLPAVQFQWKGSQVSLNEFEICDHTVTNLEYKQFIDATDYPVPLHWEKGVIPTGKKDYPVIFVNRDDAEAYAQWLTKTTGRIYRLPTDCEFYYATRGSMKEGSYYWGMMRNFSHLKTLILIQMVPAISASGKNTLNLPYGA